MKKVALHNLGCKVNSYEIDVMQQILQENGYEIVSFDQIADIYIVNTCTVTNIADRKSRQMLHKAKAKNPKAIVVAVGCYVQTGEETVRKDECIDLAIGNNRKKDIANILMQYLQEHEGEESLPFEEDVIDINHTDEYEEMQLTHTAEHTRAYIKIQDGCNQFCSYCIIPYARGRVRSRKQEDIIKEVEGLAKSGYLEIVLTGIHISSYGSDWGQKEALKNLIYKLHEIEGIERIRLGSLEPRIMSEDFVAAISKLPKICPHFHLSLQSGCDGTLKRMNRHYTTAEFEATVERLRKYFVDCAVTTDVIVGFPGETEEEFEETRTYLERLKLYEMHIFKYSKRQGTRAAVMPNQVPDQIKAKRSDVLLEMEERFSREYRESFIGKTLEVLVEEEKQIAGESYMVGHSKEYICVAIPCKQGDSVNETLAGTIVKYTASEILGDGNYLK